MTASAPSAPARMPFSRMIQKILRKVHGKTRVSLPLTPQEILGDRILYMSQIEARASPSPQEAALDTPLTSMYRFYERLVLDDTTGYRNELEYFWRRRGWPVSEIPDPKDPDPTRYAFLGAITQLYVEAFNSNIGIGLARYTPAIISPDEAEALRKTAECDKKYESRPAWSLRVPSAPKKLVIPIVQGPNLVMPDEAELEAAFKAVNIWIAKPHILFT